MSRYLLCILAIAIPTLTLAQQKSFTDKQFADCNLKAYVYSESAEMRDGGLSPQQAFPLIKNQSPGIPEKFIKTAINQVFFDSRFVNARGEAFADQVREACLYPNGKYQPLK